ncbi:MAG: gluconate 2-dehydrogenase subunit 3 family protein [Gammaproteobacteria bacterium]
MKPIHTRRRFLRTGGTLTGAAYIKLTSPVLLTIGASARAAEAGAEPFRVLTDVEAADLSAIAARLIPTTDTPGAAEAGVVHFFDQAFAGVMSNQLTRARDGLAAFNAVLASAHPHAKSLASLDPESQDAFLKTREHTDFFELVRIMTIFGFFAMEQYGGNRDHVGWRVIDFQGHGAWTPPFGYYDAEVLQEPSDGR